MAEGRAKRQAAKPVATRVRELEAKAAKKCQQVERAATHLDEAKTPELAIDISVITPIAAAA